MRRPAGIADLDRQKHHCGHRGDDGAAAGPKSRSDPAEHAKDSRRFMPAPPERPS
jgi:hypothetical protein